MDRSHPARLTSPEDSPVDRTHPARRHTVRIVQRRTPSRAAMWSLVIAMSVAAVAFAAWLWWRPAPTVPVYYRRTINDVELNWKCEAGHYFTAFGQVADRLCATCDQPAFATFPCKCRQHGMTEVAVRYTSGADGAPRVSQFRVNQGTWFPAKDPATDPLPCPHCGVPMYREKVDPLDAINRGKKKGG